MKYNLYFSKHSDLSFTKAKKAPYCFMNSDGIFILSKRAIKGFQRIPMENLDSEIEDWLTRSLVEGLAEEAQKGENTQKMIETLKAGFCEEMDKVIESR